MDAAAIRSCIVATLDADASVRKRAELQLKQVRMRCHAVSHPAIVLKALLFLCCWICLPPAMSAIEGPRHNHNSALSLIPLCHLPPFSFDA